MARVGVLMGSMSDEDMVKPALEILAKLGLDYEVSVMSAHRQPELVREFGLKAEQRGFAVIIAAAGAAAHLPGVLASWTTIPVIGVPLPSSELKGVDSLLSMAQMPSGVPVACTGIGKSGARNAALLAAQILGLSDQAIRNAYIAYRKDLAQK
ncbi:MAG: 5-(carboxyamino)imidazole ribonucleotide mutase [Chloroflexota bacterium]